MTNSIEPDQLAYSEPPDLDLHCLQKQGMYGFSRTRVKCDTFKEYRIDYFISIEQI